jgi:hypothetical protein
VAAAEILDERVHVMGPDQDMNAREVAVLGRPIIFPRLC